MPAGATDYDLSHFSIDHDKAQILPLLRQALALNPDLKVMGTPWSPPAWMKTNDSLVGGRLNDDPRIYQAYADYLVKFVQAYEAAGVPVYGLTIQNEPQNRTPSGYPGTDLPMRQAIQVIDRLGPALQAAGPAHEDLRLRPQLVRAPQRHRQHPARRGPGDGVPHRAARVERRAAGSRGTAYHCYAGDQKRMTELHQAFPDKHIWFTECSGSHGPSDPPAQVFSDTLKWHARNLTLGVTRNWAQSRSSPGTSRCTPTARPHNGGCDTCTGVVTVNHDGTVTRNAEYYTLGHLARFVKPGAVAGRQHLVRHHGVERHADERGVREPRRVDGAGGAQRVRRPAERRDLGRRPTPRLHAARRRAGHVHLARLAGLTGGRTWSTPGPRR